MIGHWAEAMGDHDPVYVSDTAAQAYGFERVIAPPTMLQAWIMPGLRAAQQREAARAAGRTVGSVRVRPTRAIRPSSP
jgi:acyl dehydratase